MIIPEPSLSILMYAPDGPGSSATRDRDADGLVVGQVVAVGQAPTAASRRRRSRSRRTPDRQRPRPRRRCWLDGTRPDHANHGGKFVGVRLERQQAWARSVPARRLIVGVDERCLDFGLHCIWTGDVHAANCGRRHRRCMPLSMAIHPVRTTSVPSGLVHGGDVDDHRRADDPAFALPDEKDSFTERQPPWRAQRRGPRSGTTLASKPPPR